MPAVPIITLLTDFGTRDHFVGSIKGVILGVNPNATLVDLSHEIEPYRIEGAGYILKASYRRFPRKTIHLAIVDPGVGSARRPILAATGNYFFIAPDNGLLSEVLEDDAPARVFHITADHYFLNPISATFHARDIFAPVAAWLSKGVDCSHFGPVIEDYHKRPIPRVESDGASVKGAVVYIDRFGNLITNITRRDLEPWLAEKKDPAVTIKGKTIRGLKAYYGQAGSGELAALINSDDLLEIFCSQASALSHTEAALNDLVTVS